MATTLAPVENREVVRCDHCHLVQFRTVNNLCRKCRTSLDEDEPEPILAHPLPVMEPETSSRSEVQVAMAIRTLRQRSGLSQRQLALRMGVPRTYVSKIENQKATRHPQFAKAGPGIAQRVIPMITRANNIPTVAVVWIQLVA